jgi:hypothetical protein
MNASESENGASPTRHFNAVLWLLLILAIGWLIYEVTHSPAWAAMAMCLKFGLEDFRTAWWLRRTDPNRGRSRACCWLHIASGLWQVAIIGVAMVIFTIALVYILQAKQGNAVGVLDLIEGAFVATVLGLILSTFATYIALMNAWRFDVRPWLNGAIHIARRKDEWPPLYGHQNRILVLVISTVLVTFIVLVPICIAILTIAVRPAIGRANASMLQGAGALVSVFVLLPISGVVIRKLRQNRFFAEHPADCWGDEPLPSRKNAAQNQETW